MRELELLSNEFEDFWSRTKVTPDGRVYFIKQLVGKVGGIKIEIYSDHNPPHLHVNKLGDFAVTLRLGTWEIMEGKITSRDYKKVLAFFEESMNRAKVKKIWEKLNPNNLISGV